MKIIIKKMLLVFIIITLSFLITSCFYLKNESYYQGEANEYFDGKRFKRDIERPSNMPSPTFFDMIKFAFGKKPKIFDWKEWEIENIHVNQAVPKEKIEEDIIKVYFINHASVLLQTNGLNILVDPVYAKKVGPLGLVGPKRVHKVGIAFEDLPNIDIILLSHSHYDHMDLSFLNKIRKRDNPTIITPVGNDYILKKKSRKFNVIPLLLDEATKYEKLKITVVPAYHWSKRGLFDTNKALWGGFVIETPKHKIYYSGDTAFGDAKIYHNIAKTYGEFSFSLLPIGAYEPNDFMKYSHTSPLEAAKIHQIVNSKKSLGVHFGTFQLSAEKREDPPKDLAKALVELKIPEDEFITLKSGESLVIK